MSSLDRDFAPWASTLLAEERDALLRYQDGLYVQINSLQRDIQRIGDAAYEGLSDQELMDILIATEAIDSAIAKGEVKEPTTVYRGVRNVGATFQGRSIEELMRRSALGDPPREPGFLSTSIREYRARNRVGSPFPEAGAVLELRLDAGQKAAWMPLLGHEAYAGQQELLLPRRTDIEIVGSHENEGVLYVEANVILEMKTAHTTPVDDQEFFLSSEADTPAVASDLLEQLKVTDAPFDAKVAAVREWLKNNTPHRMLKLSLQRHKLPTS